MKVKSGKYLLLFSLLFIFCATIFAACKDDGEPDFYFSLTPISIEENELSSTNEESSLSISSTSTDTASTNEGSLTSSTEEESVNSEISISSIGSSEESTSDSFIESSNESSFDSSIDSSTESSSDSLIESSGSEDSKTPSCGDQNHQPGDWVVDHVFKTVSQQPTCLISGYSRTFCIGCDLQLEYEFYPELGHEEVVVSGFDSTCCTHGATESSYCSRCFVVLESSEELPFSDHDYLEGCCKWCDLTELKFEKVKREFEDPYAVCIGPAKLARRVVIPEEVTFMDGDGRTSTYIVKEIKESAFARHYEMYSIEIGKNIERIGEDAFDCCLNLRLHL